MRDIVIDVMCGRSGSSSVHAARKEQEKETKQIVLITPSMCLSQVALPQLPL